MSWWILALGVAAGVLPRVRLEPPALIMLALLVTMACLTALSINWAWDNGEAFRNVVQMISVVGIFAVCLAVSTREGFRGWINGMALGLGFIVLLAVASRWFPGLGDDAALSSDIGGVAGRLSWPIGYWNALASVVATFICLCAWLGTNARSRDARAAATGFMALGMLALYMTSSRGSVVAVVLGVAILFAGGPKRVRLVATLLIGAVAGLILIRVAAPMHDLLLARQNSQASAQGLLLLGACLLVCQVTGIVRSQLEGRIDAFRVPKLSPWLLAVPAVLLVLALVVLNPVSDIKNFTVKPAVDPVGTTRSNATDHLFSSSGNGRWQFWTTAFDAFKSEPVRGIGAGGFQNYYSQYGEVPVAVKHTHSLPMQILAELGLIGFIVLLGLFGVPLYVGLNRWLSGRRRSGTGGSESERPISAAALKPGNPEAGFIESWQSIPLFASVFAVGAVTMSIDWVSEFAVVTGPVLIAAAAMVGASTAASSRPKPAEGTRSSLIIMFSTVAVAGVCLWASFASFGSQNHLDASRSAVDDGNLPAAAVEAQDAIDATPWDAAPRIQLALVQELAGHYSEALHSAQAGTERSPLTGTYYILQARLLLRLGRSDEAQFALLTAKKLDPKNPIVSGLPG